MNDAVRSPWLGALPGAARQPLTFFASPKKVSKERRPQQSSPATRVPKPSDRQPASQTNSLRSNMFAPLDPSDNRSPWQRLMRIRQKHSLDMQREELLNLRGCVDVPLRRCRLCGAKNGKRSGRCLSAASFVRFPFFALHKREPRRGCGFAVAFFCLLFLARQEK